jgi:stage VI sporulation protein D
MPETTGLRFDLYERVHLAEKIDGLEQLDQIELLPYIEVDVQDDQVVLRGHLKLSGQYAEGVGESPGRLEHEIPVEITLPKSRISSLEEIGVEIEHFDVDLIAPQTLNVTGVLQLNGVVLESDREGLNGREEEEKVFIHEASAIAEAAQPSGQQEAVDAAVSPAAWAEALDQSGARDPADGEDLAQLTEPVEQAEFADTRSGEGEPPDDEVAAAGNTGEVEGVTQAAARAEDVLGEESAAAGSGAAESGAAESGAAESGAAGSGAWKSGEEEEPAAVTAAAGAREEAGSPPVTGFAASDPGFGVGAGAETGTPAGANAGTAVGGGRDLPDQSAAAWSAGAAEPVSQETSPDQAEPVREAQEDALPAGAGGSADSFSVQQMAERSVRSEPGSADASQEQGVRVAIAGRKTQEEEQGQDHAAEIRSLLYRQISYQKEAAAEPEPAQETPRQEQPAPMEWKSLFLGRTGSEEEQFSRLRMCIVQKEETLDTIAERYKLNPREIALYNRLGSDATVQAGQVLYIPK